MPLLIGIVILLLLVLGLRWYAGATPRMVMKAVAWAVLILLAVVVFLLLISGNAGWAMAAGAGLVSWGARVARLYGLFSTLKPLFGGMGGGKRERTSTVETRFLIMALDHDSGALSGTVRSGAFAGRELSGLSFDEALELRRQCAADPQSVQVLDAWLDRTWPDWHARAGRSDVPSDAGGDMSRAEAYEILGLRPGAEVEEIKAAYRHLMATAHPDRGGSTYLAAKINRARDILLGG